MNHLVQHNENNISDSWGWFVDLDDKSRLPRFKSNRFYIRPSQHIVIPNTIQELDETKKIKTKLIRRIPSLYESSININTNNFNMLLDDINYETTSHQDDKTYISRKTYICIISLFSLVLFINIL
jgi:hypothetical protein